MFDCQFTLSLGKKKLEVFLQYQESTVGIFGASGLGKTSILHAIAGIHRPKIGHIRINGQTWFDSHQNINLSTQKRRVGLVFQDAQLFPHKTVDQNLRFGYDHLKPSEQTFNFDEIVALLKLKPLLNRLPIKLSGGEKQRVALGRAILYSPNLLLMDEPLSALDSELKSEILPFFEHIVQNLSIPMLYVSHDRLEIQRLTKTIYDLNKNSS